jgi:hypothetical protein
MVNKSRAGLSVRSKLMGVVLFMTLVSVGVGFIAYLGFSRTNLLLDEISGQFIPELALIDDIDYQVAVARRYEKDGKVIELRRAAA